MDPDSTTPIIVLLVLVLLHAFFAAAEVAIVTIRKSRLSQLIEEGYRPAQLVSAMAEDATRLLATTQLALKFLGFLAIALAAATYGNPLAGWLTGLNLAWLTWGSLPLAIGAITLGLAVLVLLFGELLPRELAARNPEPFAFWAAYPMRAAAVVAMPLARLVVAITHLFIGQGDEVSHGLPFIIEEEIKTLVDAGEEGGFIEEEEKEMIYSIFEFGDTLAREVMVPRIDMVAVEVSASITDALEVVVQAGHSRVPVYEETIDNIVGIFYAKDILRYWRSDTPSLKLKDILRAVYYIPETKKVDELLQELQQRKVHIAIVVDEYGGTAGLVTIEDILEEIVGEIQDEYDREEAFMEVVSQDEIIFNGRMDLDDVNHIMGLTLPTDSSDTLGGLVYSRLGRVPVVGDQVTLQNVEITVLSVVRRQIKKVKVVRLLVEGDLSDSFEAQAISHSSPSTSNAHTSNTSPHAGEVAHEPR
ncbi:MAG: HlyC/CorC family transporter [Anaerolineales bacterium]|nr:MAG: HlyC/CorC family transporter [Anaerolineales bacterium]